MRARLSYLFLLFATMTCQPTKAVRQLELKIATLNYPPYVDEHASHQPTGLAVELIEHAFGRMDQPIAIEFLPFKRSLANLESGRIDALFPMRKTPERESRYDFALLPLLKQDIQIFVRANSTIQFSGNPGQLAGYSIGVLHGASYGIDLKKFSIDGGYKKLEPSSSHEMNFRKLLAGRMDAVLCSRLVGLAILKGLNASADVKMIGPPVGSYDSYIMFNKNKVPYDVIAKFRQTMTDMNNDGTLTRLRKKYKQ